MPASRPFLATRRHYIHHEMDKPTIRRATLLVMAIFWVQPLALGGWLALIPAVKADLGLSTGELAFAILGMPIATLIFLQVGGRLVLRFGVRRSLAWMLPAQGLAFLLPLAATDLTSLFVALFVAGAGVGVNEVAFNVYAGRLEKRAGVQIMNRCHGFWALGLMAGSAVVAASGGSYAAVATLSLGSGAVGSALALGMPRLPGDEPRPAPPVRRSSELPPALPRIAIFVFFVTVTEGAMADWSALHLAQRLGGATDHAGIAVTIFASFMAGGRFVGDWLKRRLGGVGLARTTTVFAILGMLAIVLPLPLAFLYAGFAMVGFGISAAYPLGVSAVAALDDTHEEANIGAMAMVALSGFLLGPPIIGGLGEMATLGVGLSVLIPGLVVALWLTRWLAGGDGGDPVTLTTGESRAIPR